MRFNFRSPNELFTDPLKEYCEAKLGRPVEKLKLDPDTVIFDLEATQLGENTGLRVLMHQPGAKITVSTLHKDAYAAVDLALDKLTRKLSRMEERRRDLKRRKPRTGEINEEIYMTEDEEEVLKRMGALDEVLES